MISFDGQQYERVEDIPEMGSIVCTSIDGTKRNYEGKWADHEKLPKYDDLGTGSTGFLSDNGKFVLCKYYADSKTWEGKGMVW